MCVGRARTAVLLAILGATFANATISNCETGSSPDYGNITFGGANNIGNGCRNVDLTFSMFNATGSGFNVPGGVDGVPTTAEIGLNALGIPNGTGTNGLGIQFLDTTLAGNDPNDWTVAANGPADHPQWSSQLYFVVTADPGTLINGVTFSHSAISTNAEVVSIIAEFCPSGLDINACGAGYLPTGTSGIVGDIAAQSYSSAIALATQVAVRVTISIDLGGFITPRQVVISDTSFQFDTITPEPGTFGLIGGGLAGIVLLAVRRRSWSDARRALPRG